MTYWQQAFQGFYVKALAATLESSKLKFPKQDNWSETQYNNAIKAYSFDVCRGWLPAGLVTNVAFTGTFDLINTHFGKLLFHPCAEVADLAKRVLTDFANKYKYAAFNLEKSLDRNSHCTGSTGEYYQEVSQFSSVINGLEVFERNAVSDETTAALCSREPRRGLSKLYNLSLGTYRYTNTIDFASFRDLHRHRNGDLNMPVLTTELGFHDYYLDKLPKHLQFEASELLVDFETAYNTSETIDRSSKLDLQYAVPMGYKVAFAYECRMNQQLYMLELRTQQTVHPTLREVMINWAQDLKKVHPGISTSGMDLSPSLFSLLRGKQTITVESK